MNIFIKFLRQLSRRELLTQNDLLHVYSPVTGKDHYVQLGDLLVSGNYPNWVATNPPGYALNATVTYGLRLWKSLQAGNLNNIPNENVFWTEVSASQVNASLWGGLWNFAANGNNFPTALIEGKLYVAQDDRGVPGDADYVQAGTWMAAKVNGANEFSEYYTK